MDQILVMIAVTSVAYIGTNLDNLLLLSAMYARYAQYAAVVTAGYFAGMILIGAIAALIGESGDFIPLAYLGLLGVIPIALGVFSLWKLFRKSNDTVTSGAVTRLSGQAIFFTLVLTQLSNGADSIVTFSALLAESTDRFDYVIGPTFLVMVGIFAGVAYYSLKHPQLSRFLGRYGQYVTPFILILVGFYILSNTATDLVPA